MNLSLEPKALALLRGKRNLLAFSGGVDSSALFYLLIEEGVKFDIALVNYQLREESILEEEYAKKLAKRYNIKAYTIKAPKFKNNFEKRARDFRYSFFESLIEEFEYKNLITAHQLNDQLEWFLMRLTKGAGLVELLGFSSVIEREEYNIVRPLLNISKEELVEYLNKNRYKYFIDKSNSDIKYERNYFRENFADRLIREYREGIKRSFEYLQRDKSSLLSGYRELFRYKSLVVVELFDLSLKSRVADIYLKRLGYLLSSAQRVQIEESNSVVVGGVWAVEISNSRYLYIAPYILNQTIPKRFREECRVLKIPPKVRGYVYKMKIPLSSLKTTT